ncbi:hypothetical protein [Alteromonas confluentis]|nr:hypothetical protein [Alteromonas confluentis]
MKSETRRESILGGSAAASMLQKVSDFTRAPISEAAPLLIRASIKLRV